MPSRLVYVDWVRTWHAYKPILFSVQHKHVSHFTPFCWVTGLGASVAVLFAHGKGPPSSADSWQQSPGSPQERLKTFVLRPQHLRFRDLFLLFTSFIPCLSPQWGKSSLYHSPFLCLTLIRTSLEPAEEVWLAQGLLASFHSRELVMAWGMAGTQTAWVTEGHGVGANVALPLTGFHGFSLLFLA